MKSLHNHRTWTTAVVCVSLALQSIGAAAEPRVTQGNPVKLRASDVQLDTRGALTGQLVDRQGTPLPNSMVTLWSGGKMLSRCVTTGQGSFQFAGIRGGLYQVAAENTGGTYRVWTNQTAPPSSRSGILLIQGDAVRGQCTDCMYANHPCDVCQAGFGGGHYGGSVIRALNNPWVLGGVVAAGIAVPIAVSNSDDRDGS